MSALRQLLREKSGKNLDKLIDKMATAARDVANQSGIKPSELMKITIGGRTDTLRTKLVTILANDLEADLLNMYNNQQDLPLDEPMAPSDKGKSP